MERSRLLLLLSVVIAAEVTAVVAIPLSVQRFKEVGNGPSTQSNEFYVGFLPNQPSTQSLTLTITTTESVTFNVTVAFQSTVLANVTVPPYGSVSVSMPNELRPAIATDAAGNMREVNKGVRITAPANRKISVYGINAAYASVDTFVAAASPSYSFLNRYAYPYEYYIFSAVTDAATNDRPGFMAVAGQNNTEIIYIVPIAYLRKDQYAPKPYRGYSTTSASPQVVSPSRVSGYNYSMNLQQRQTYYFSGETNDLTGVSIKSSKPISVYSGHSCAFVEVATCDHVVEQVTPTVTWGKLFFSPPIYGRADGGSKDLYRVIAVVSSTTITVTMSGSKGYISNATYSMSKGAVQELQIPKNTFITVESNKPIYVMQYQKGRGSSSIGDPYIATIAPVEQYLSSYVVVPYELSNFIQFKSPSQLYLAIAVLDVFYDKNQIFVDNKTLEEANPSDVFTTNQWYPLHCFDGKTVSVCGHGAIVSMNVAEKSYYIKHSNPKAGLFVNVQGLNDQISFGHSAGYEVEALQEPAFSFGAPTYNFPEGNGASSVVSVKVVKQDDLQLLNTVAVNVTVSFPSPGQLLPPNTNVAQLNVDFSYATTTLVFGPNDQEKLVNFTIIGNQIPQPNKQFYFNLASTVLLSPYPSATITILDDDGTPMVQARFNPTVYNVTSNAGNVNLMVQKNGVSGTPILVTVSTTDLTAKAGQDYTSTIQTLTFQPSSDATTTLPVSVPILNSNNIAGESKTFLATLTSSTPGVTLVNTQATINIINNNAAIVQFASASYSVLENAGSVNVCLNKSLQTQTDFSVMLYPAELIPQSAQAGKDFNGNIITATFPGTNSQLCVPIPINDNSIALEGIKTFQVTFSIPSVSWLRMGTLKDSNVVIIDNDVPTVTLTSTTYTTQEGQPAQVCVTKDLLTASDISGVITANPIVASNAATPLVQFKNGPYPFTIAAGVRVTCVNITTYDDKIMTGPRVFSASIGQATSTGGVVTVGNPSTAQVTIVDNNVIPFSFVTNNVPVPKNANTTTVCLQKLGNSTQTISVTVYTTPLTALPGVDFTPVQQTLSFLPSDTIKCLSIPILDDGIAFTGDKIFKVGFNTSSTTLYPKGSIPESTVTIQDQSVVRVSFTAPIYVVRQSQGPATVCIVATPRAAVPVTVTVVAGEDPSPSARASTDFSAGSYVITIPANIPTQSPFCTNIPIVDSQVAFQPNKTFTVTLQPPNSRVVVSPPSQVLIVDDHPIIVTAVTPNGTYPSVPQVCFKSDRNVSVSTVVKIVGDITTVASTTKTVSTYIVFSPNNAVACVDLSNYTEISTVILKPEEPPKSDQTFKPPPSGANVVMIIIPQSTPAPNVATVNDTVIGDPLYAVPLLLNISNPLDGPALCYEVHGAPNTIFNLVSDSCTSVNAYYSPAIISSDPVAINVITKIGVVAIDSSGVCQWIKVDLDGCTAFVNGVQVNTSYQQADIGVRRIGDRVRVSVPNCGKPNLVSWVVCEQTMGVRMMRFVISRGLNLTPTSHGIIGQFWNIPISMVHYSGTLPQGYDSIDPLYIITVNPPRSPSRSFLGEQYGRTWDNTKKTCYYSGGAQGGRTGVATPDNSVIEGTYTDYITSDLFSTQFLYTQFKGCPSGSVA